MELNKEILDRMRKADGFPAGKDEDIVRLSDPPYYTACPNPFVSDFIEKAGSRYDEESDDYNVEPFTGDVTEGKNDPIYNIHPYHTKVPYKAIMRYIFHYTKPGDLVYDGFSGSGMTGVAARMCGTEDADIRLEINNENPGKSIRWGERRAVLFDISPIAGFISYNYNTPVDVGAFIKEANRILSETRQEYGWVYETNHIVGGKPRKNTSGENIKGEVNYVVWSDVYICSNCSRELILWETGVDEKTGNTLESIKCGHCGAIVRKSNLDRAFDTLYDGSLGETIRQVKQVPVMIKYTVNKKMHVKAPDEFDYEIIKRVAETDVKYWHPVNRMPDGEESRRNDRFGLTHIHHFYTKRNLLVLASFFDKISSVGNKRIRDYLLFLFTSIYSRTHRLNRYMPNHRRHVGPLAGTLYLPFFQAEINIFNLLSEKLGRFGDIKSLKESNIVSVQSSTGCPQIADGSIDYIFTDPPFGDNIMYSELNTILEAWLRVFTNNAREAVINDVQKKRLHEYQSLMEKCFEENYRILKPGRWMTVVFHNSQNSVWNAIQEAILKAGFVIANVETLDKKKGTTKQLSYSMAVKQDLVISAYKPKNAFVRKFLFEAGTEEGVWDFIREHLGKLPTIVESNGKLDVIPGRQNFLLYDNMVAFHIQKGATVPMGASDFYIGLKQRFPERDGMYFLPGQVSIYDSRRITQELNKQQSLFVLDEKTAIQWLHRQLASPRTYQEIQPEFLRELRQLKHEKMPELRDLLEENFLQDDAGKWYVPDVNKQSDLEKLRDKKLLKEFDEYREGKGRLRVFRTEAVRSGFKHCWREKDYETIVNIGERLPENVVQEDPGILMYYDNALTRIGD
jgi:DNA modification methylase/DNA-directed RNA polymerase subunit RPC12/RpoP